MNTDPFGDPEFQLDFQSGAYRQDLLGHGNVRVNLPVPMPRPPLRGCPATHGLAEPDDDAAEA